MAAETAEATPQRPRVFRILNNANGIVGPNRAAREIGRSILSDVFSQQELDSIRRNIRETQDVFGTGHGDALIHAFARRGRASVVEFLLNKGADIDSKDKKGITPLICAVIEGHVDTVKLLLERGANLEATFGGNTVLMEAVIQNHEDIVIMLLQHGAVTEARNREGCTAVHIAAASSYVRVVRSLLDAGAEIDAKDRRDITPLMTAAVRNKLWMVSLLLERGANVNAKDKDGETALVLHQNREASKMMAFSELYERRNTPIAKLLEDEMRRRMRLNEVGVEAIRRNRTI
jgi:ankyrin repeat protein